jgi:hypothetical protein
MKINFENVPIYCLTCDMNGERKKHVEMEFENVKFINPILGISKYKSGASGFIRMIEEGLMLQKFDEPFKPFILMEDDVSYYEKIDDVDIPNDTDILYIGLSRCSMNSNSYHHGNYYESIDGYPNIVRIKNMLASHGIMICSSLGASAIQRCMMEIWYTDKGWDIPMSYIQPYYNVYALRKPLVYQDSKYGGMEIDTKIELNSEDKILPDEYINRDLDTIKIANKKIKCTI